MGHEPDNPDDLRTWHQPMPGQGGGRPHDQPTARDAPPDDDETASVPEATRAERTSPAGEVSQVPVGRSGTNAPAGDTQQTQPMSRETSSEWDALPPPVLEAGQVVFDKYRLIEKIGEGGMGEVWRVWHVHLDAERALKLIKPELAHNDKGWRRFQREARLMAKINHPNAVAVYDFRRTQSVGYIEMEYIRGRSLSEILKDGDGKPLPLDWTARVLEQLCAVLHEAHGHADEATGQAKPIIHRDLKPSNLMVVEGKDESGPPRLKVLDFGIAKIVEDEGSPELTGAGDLVGTPAYMSPEQIRGGFERDAGFQAIDARSDLYSAGVVLYHLLTGTIPFRGGKMALLAAHLNTAPMPMKVANPEAEVPPEVERVVLQCLEKDPDRRPQTARALCERFLQAAGTDAAAPRRSPAGSARSRRLIVAAAAVALVALAGVGAAMLARDTRKPSIDPARTRTDPGGTAAAPAVPRTEPVAAQAALLWVPKGYEAVDPNDIVPNHPGFPVNLRRLDDRVGFVFFRDRVYLPEGYDPESPEDLLGDPGWPRALIRRRDKARFIRIRGAVYRRGAPGAPAVDFADNPISPHHVRVPGFYIQETEVTNGEIEGYAREHPDDPDLTHWRDWIKAFKGDHPDPARYPAACVDYPLARKYARSVAGLLPTEAQWEWAAKSQHNEFRFAWGEEMTQPGAAARARLNDPNANVFEPAPVKSYPKDQTGDHVFDMVGNLRELCADAYVPYTALRLAGNSPGSPLVDERRPVDPSDAEAKVVVRGGSFQYGEPEATAFYRWRESPRKVPADVGFRVVLECPADAEGSP